MEQKNIHFWYDVRVRKRNADCQPEFKNKALASTPRMVSQGEKPSFKNQYTYAVRITLECVACQNSSPGPAFPFSRSRRKKQKEIKADKRIITSKHLFVPCRLLFSCRIFLAFSSSDSEIEMILIQNARENRLLLRFSAKAMQ